MKTRFLNYFRFTRAERNGTLALLILAAAIFILPEWLRYFRPDTPDDFSVFKSEIQVFKAAFGADSLVDPASGNPLFYFNPNTANVEELSRLGLPETVVERICHYREKGGKFAEAADFQKIWGLDSTLYERLAPYIRLENRQEKTQESPAKESLFAFDPNTASQYDLLRLGLPTRTVNSILHYREKGGRFRKVEDLQKIYTLSEEDFNRIAPYAEFSQTDANPGGAYARPVQNTLLDINRASTESLLSLPGIGEGRARQIINFRDKLGGFVSVEQVAETRALPDSVFRMIQPFLECHADGLRKINLNTANADELDTHPYISRRQAEIIVAYRAQHGPFKAPSELGDMLAFTDKAWVGKVLPYLTVE